MLIPALRHTGAAGAEPFANALDEATAALPRDEAPPPPPEAEPVATETEAAAAAPTEPERREPAATAAAPDRGEPTGESTPAHAAASPDATDTLRRGEPVRQPTAGKGAGSPRTSPAATNGTEPLLAAIVQHANVDRLAVAGSPGRAITAVGAAARAGTAPAAAPAIAEQRPAMPLRTAATAASYRTTAPAGAELLEHARDSVFKQILLQLQPDGGEMRLRLEPPDLGELDLRLLVENGNRLSLTIAAERADLAQLLQKHLAELQRTLEAAGLDVASAQVHTRGRGDQADGGHHGRSQRDGARRDAVDDANPTLLGRGYVRADGLDFWA